MGYLKNKILLILFFLPLVSYGQWSYTFTDPCTLTQQTIQIGGNNAVALNYFGNVQTFSQDELELEGHFNVKLFIYIKKTIAKIIWHSIAMCTYFYTKRIKNGLSASENMPLY